MKQTTKARMRWRALVERQEKSGLSVSAFCEREKIPQATFYQWRKRLSESDMPAGTLVPVTVISPAAIEIDLPCGATVKVPPNEQALQQVLRLLLSQEGQDSC